MFETAKWLAGYRLVEDIKWKSVMNAGLSK